MDDVAWRFRVEHRTVFRQAFDEDYREVMEHPKYEEFVEYLYDYFLAKDADIYAVAVKRNPHKYN